MPAEPDNTMGDLLKTYAKKRRDETGAPLDLHPATRRLLQGEVARLRPASSLRPRSWFSSWLVDWPQLSAAASILVVLGIGYRVLLQEQEAPVGAGQFAKRQGSATEAESLDRLNRPAPAADSPVKAETGQDKSGAFRRLNEVGPMPAVSEARDSKDAGAKGGETTVRQLAKAKEDRAQSTGGRIDLGEINQTVATAAEKKSVQLARNEPAVERDALLRQLAPTAPATPPPVPPREPGVASDPRRMKAATSDLQASSVARAPAGAATVTLADELAATAPTAAGAGGPAQAIPRQQAYYRLAGATDGRGLAAGQRQRFTQASPPGGGVAGNLGQSAAQGVLASFELQHDGARLRAIDADGSIYEGQFNDSTNVTTRNGLVTAAPASPPVQAPANRPAPSRISSESVVAAAMTGESGVRFRLTGTNKTLKQLVVFEGTLTGGASSFAPAPQPGPTISPAADSLQKLPLDASTTAQGPQLSSPIQGTLRIGTSNAVPVQALPVSR